MKADTIQQMKATSMAHGILLRAMVNFFHQLSPGGTVGPALEKLSHGAIESFPFPAGTDPELAQDLKRIMLTEVDAIIDEGLSVT